MVRQKEIQKKNEVRKHLGNSLEYLQRPSVDLAETHSGGFTYPGCWLLSRFTGLGWTLPSAVSSSASRGGPTQEHPAKSDGQVGPQIPIQVSVPTCPGVSVLWLPPWAFSAPGAGLWEALSWYPGSMSSWSAPLPHWAAP